MHGEAVGVCNANSVTEEEEEVKRSERGALRPPPTSPNHRPSGPEIPPQHAAGVIKTFNHPTQERGGLARGRNLIFCFRALTSVSGLCLGSAFALQYGFSCI